MQFYTYIYRDPSRNNEPIYVGEGNGKRAWHHLRRKDRHPLTQRIQYMARHSVTTDIEIIDALDELHSFFMEECCISVIGRRDLNKGPLLNLTDGGDGSSNPSPETREKIGAANRGRKCTAEQNRANSDARKGKPTGRLGMPNPMKKSEPHQNNGKVRTQEFKDNLSRLHNGKPAWNKGVPATDEHKLKNSIANLGRKDSDEVRAKKSAATKGKPKSAEHRAAISASRKLAPKIECEYCGVMSMMLNHIVNHGNKCKLKDKDKDDGKTD